MVAATSAAAYRGVHGAVRGGEGGHDHRGGWGRRGGVGGGSYVLDTTSCTTVKLRELNRAAMEVEPGAVPVDTTN